MELINELLQQINGMGTSVVEALRTAGSFIYHLWPQIGESVRDLGEGLGSVASGVSDEVKEIGYEVTKLLGVDEL